MAETPKKRPQVHENTFSREIGKKEARKLRAQRHQGRGIWFGLGTIGVIGWSVALPTVLGAALGVWLDHRHPGKYSWTLMLLTIGLVLGCWNAAHWLVREQKEIRKEQEDGHNG